MPEPDPGSHAGLTEKVNELQKSINDIRQILTVYDRLFDQVENRIRRRPTFGDLKLAIGDMQGRLGKINDEKVGE